MTERRGIHPHDIGLPESAIRQRRRSHRTARIMLIIAGLTALAGWSLFGFSISAAVRMREESPYRAIIAYGILIVSSVTLILGLWYLLLAQVERVARMTVGNPEEYRPAATLCPNCGWPIDPPDRFCRHCGKPLGASIAPPTTMKK